jgi:hypothetical protein
MTNLGPIVIHISHNQSHGAMSLQFKIPRMNIVQEYQQYIILLILLNDFHFIMEYSKSILENSVQKLMKPSISNLGFLSRCKSQSVQHSFITAKMENTQRHRMNILDIEIND